MADLTFKEFLHYFQLICNSNVCEECPMKELDCGMPDESEATKYEKAIKEWIQKHSTRQDIVDACTFINNLPANEFCNTYEQGLEDAWNAFKTLYDMNLKHGGKKLLSAIFDVEEMCFQELLESYSSKEVIQKLHEWEETRVKIGDVINYNNGEKIGYVSDVEDDGHIKVFFPDSDIWYGFITQDIVKKTGRSVARELNDFLNVVKGEENERIH